MTPKIAIPMPTTFDPAYNRLNYSAYADAVRNCGGEPIEVALSLDEAEVRRLADECEGILLPGSPADVDPTTFGQERDEATAPADAARERVDRTLLEEAYRARKPVFGICFGTQMLNVFRGGSLVQDLAAMPVNHPAGRGVAVAHTAAVAAGSLLSGIVDESECARVEGLLRLPMNSSHHQAVGIPGAGLQVSARCPQDGVVEAVEAARDGVQSHFVLGVQWHPERTMDSSSTSRALFNRFVDEAGRWRR
jgi:putative glutamine amidotransferase